MIRAVTVFGKKTKTLEKRTVGFSGRYRSMIAVFVMSLFLCVVSVFYQILHGTAAGEIWKLQMVLLHFSCGVSKFSLFGRAGLFFC